MDSLNQPLSDIVCKQLQQFIEEGRWENTLPGINRLCTEMKVSRHTMMLAMRQLEQENYVSKISPGKAREINTNTARVTLKSTTTSVIGFISSVPMALLGTVEKEISDLVEEAAVKKGYRIMPIIFNEITTVAGVKKLEELILHNKADIYVVLSAHRACSIKLRELSTPVVYLGGEQVKRCTPRVAFSIVDMCSQAIEFAKKRGHQRIVYFATEAYNRCRDKKVAKNCFMKTKALFALHELPFSAYNCPYWGKTKESFEVALEDAFRITPPTAIIVSKATHIPRVVSFLMKRDLKFPDDVSLIALDESFHNDDFVPPITYLKKSTPQLVEILMTEIAKMLAGETRESDELSIAKTELIATASVKDISASRQL